MRVAIAAQRTAFMSAGYIQRSLLCVDDMTSLPVTLDTCDVTSATYTSLRSERFMLGNQKIIGLFRCRMVCTLDPTRVPDLATHESLADP